MAERIKQEQESKEKNFESLEKQLENVDAATRQQVHLIESMDDDQLAGELIR